MIFVLSDHLSEMNILPLEETSKGVHMFYQMEVKLKWDLCLEREPLRFSLDLISLDVSLKEYTKSLFTQ